MSSVKTRLEALERKLNIALDLERDLEISERPGATPEEIERGIFAALRMYRLEDLLDESKDLEDD